MPEDRGSPENEERFHRRGFFAHGFRQLLKPLADLVEDRVEKLNLPELMGPEEPTSSTSPGRYGPSTPYPAGGVIESPSRVLLRPPGALPEGEFLDRCTSCGKCVEVCPVHAIKLVASVEPKKDRKPAIDPSAQACVVCDDLSCMKACPTGALQLVPRAEIRMGLAVLHPTICVRTHGEDCQICVDKCPIGPSAIEIPGPGAPVSVKSACTGCGVCEMYCPTDPKAIVIEARA
jgi:ferredoxin-type protein NapG